MFYVNFVSYISRLFCFFGCLCLFQLCAVTLELFHKLVDLNCEDLMLELVLRSAS